MCRYCEAPPDRPECAGCGTESNLWICLICGFIGCGRYAAGHAVSHYQQTGHCYSMEVETQRVWDYLNDGYVHRLIASKTHGHLVELTPVRFCCGKACEACAAELACAEALAVAVAVAVIAAVVWWRGSVGGWKELHRPPLADAVALSPAQPADRGPRGGSGGDDCGGPADRAPDDPGMEEALLASKLDNIVRLRPLSAPSCSARS